MAKALGGEYEYGQLYRSEDKVYPREVKGRFATLRRIAMFVLLGAFYGGPWLRWDDRQAVLFDLPARKFYIFELTLWPQDFIYLALLLIVLAVSLFFFTALAGRLWCGYACPKPFGQRRLPGSKWPWRGIETNESSWIRHHGARQSSAKKS